jgi:hypothetical protein
MRLDFSVSAHKQRRRDLVRELKNGSFRLGGFYSTLSAFRFRGIVRGRLRGLRPLDAVHGRAVGLARGRPERSESRDDDLLSENVGIGEIVGGCRLSSVAKRLKQSAQHRPYREYPFSLSFVRCR